jgi:hypothetical protein
MFAVRFTSGQGVIQEPIIAGEHKQARRGSSKTTGHLIIGDFSLMWFTLADGGDRRSLAAKLVAISTSLIRAFRIYFAP